MSITTYFKFAVVTDEIGYVKCALFWNSWDINSQEFGIDGSINMLMLASHFGAIKVIKWLLKKKKLKLDLKSLDGETALQCSIKHKHYEIARLLIRAGAD